MLQLYGNPRSRAMRCLWMLEEMGEAYQLIEKSTRTDELQSAEYVRLNPNARIPTLVDGDFAYGSPWPSTCTLRRNMQGRCTAPIPKY
jgi:glutathione S-transferase